MEPLSLFKQARYEGRPKKKKPAKRKGGKGGGGERRGGASFGKIFRMPTIEGEGGGKISCPCGQVYLLPSALGGFIFFDSEGELGKSSLPLGDLDTYRVEMIERAHGMLYRFGCRVHARGDKLEGSHLVPVVMARTGIHTHGRGEK